MPVPPVIQMYRYVMGSGGLGNLLKASEEFQQTRDWVRYPTNSQTPTVNDDSRPDPNGGGTADQVGLTANTSARLQQTVTLSASTEYTFSVYARAVSGTVDFRMRNVTLKDAEVKTATTTGPDGGGFTRFTYTFTTTTAGPYELALQNDTNATAKDVIFWGAMLNQGGTALDYQYAAPTTGGSAPAPAYAGFGDAFGGVTAYYSLRQFTEAETLNAIRVRRSSDDTEQDIGFDSNGDLDTTALLAFVNEDYNAYTSDFSSDVDGWSGTNTSLTAPAIIDGVGGALKSELTGGNIGHQTLENVGFTINSISYKVSFDYYIPSTNSVVNAIGITEANEVVSVIDEWTSYETDDFIPTSTFIRFRPNSFGFNPIDADGDVFYLKNIVITQTTADGAVTTFYDQTGNGNDATNSTASEQPLVVSGGTLVTENSKAAILSAPAFTNNLLRATFTLPQPLSIVGVVKTPLDRDQVPISSQNTTLRAYRRFATSDNFLIQAGFSQFTGSETLEQSLEFAVYNGLSSIFALDGNLLISANFGTNGLDNLDLFQSNGTLPSYETYLQEIIIFDSDQSANRGTVTTGGGTGIEGNINEYFDIV